MANKSEAKKGLDIGRLLVYGAAAFQAYHMGRAFYVYDPAGWHLGNVNVGGLILGAILNVIVAQAAMHLPTISATFSSLKELLPKVNKKADKKEERARAQALKKMLFAMKQNAYSQVGFYVLLVFSVVMVAPALYILWSATLPFAPFFIGFMAVVGAVAPDVAITVGGFISSDAGSDGQRRSATKPATLSDAGSDAQRPHKRKSATVSVVPTKIYQCACNYETENRYEFSGHTRTCKTYQDNKRVPLDPTLLIDSTAKKVVK